ncbi:MAG: hypothetical protein ACXAB2_13555 [Candidatus Hodarchaeales archaeon]|jgi:hypothetical protein
MAKLILINDDPDLLVLVESILKDVHHEFIGETSLEIINAIVNPRAVNQNH